MSDLTTTDSGAISGAMDSVVPALTLLWHPSLDRVGHVALLVEVGFGRSVSVSRLDPGFGAPGEPASDPIGHKSVSRDPVRFEDAGGGAIVIDSTGSARRLVVDGEELDGRRIVRADDVDRGVVIELSRRVAVLLHRVDPSVEPQPDHGLVGKSVAIERTRAQITALATHDSPVLVVGESGVGKELVAQAVHASSKRSSGPLVAVNMAAVPAGTAASDLFGHRRGAFTGAVSASEGYFQQADGGTLFLDEVGAAPVDVQGALLRVLETGELQPVGSESNRTVDARVLAATDVDLDGAVEAGRFRLPLLHRLRSFELRIPPLRERREDVGRLLAHFVAAELDEQGASMSSEIEPRLSEALTSSVVSALTRYHWPGNVRELRNIVRRLVLQISRPELGPDPALQAILDAAPASSRRASRPARPASKRPSRRRRIDEIDDAEVIEALEGAGWKPSRAAEALGVSRTTMYALMQRSGAVQKAADLPSETIVSELDACAGDPAAAAARLRVSERGLRLRMKQLGIAG